MKLAPYGKSVEEIVTCAVSVAKEAAYESGRDDVFVALDFLRLSAPITGKFHRGVVGKADFLTSLFYGRAHHFLKGALSIAVGGMSVVA